MNNEYPNYPPQEGAPGFTPAPPIAEPIPDVVIPPVQPNYQAQPAYQQPPYQAQPNYQTPPTNGYPNQQPYTPPAGYYNYNQPNHCAPVPEEQPAAVWKVFAVLGLVLGIIGLVFCWVPAANIFFITMSIFAIVFSALGKKSRSGVATAGLVISIIGTVLGFILAVAYASAMGVASYSYYGF